MTQGKAGMMRAPTMTQFAAAREAEAAPPKHPPPLIATTVVQGERTTQNKRTTTCGLQCAAVHVGHDPQAAERDIKSLLISYLGTNFR